MDNINKEKEQHETTGFTDEVAKEDLFNIEDYLGKVSLFLENCNTPMTVSIQGEWGSGKTSIMRLVEKRINKKYKGSTIFFNTWQFSQFDLGDSLSFSMIQFLLDDLKVYNFKYFKNLFYSCFNNLLSVIRAISFSSNFFNVGFFKNPKIKDANYVEKIKKLHDEFQNCINSYCKKRKIDRVIIFVDDLDRLNPAKAVDLLEVLKLFLDCKNCVFVLAIDTEVLINGVIERFSKESKLDRNQVKTIDEKSYKKAKSFFDKIFQISFRVPVENYVIKDFLKDCFAQLDLDIDNHFYHLYIDFYDKILRFNPRKLKRVFNELLIVLTLKPNEICRKNNRQIAIIFFGLSLKLYDDDIYNLFISNFKKYVNGNLVFCLQLLSELATGNLPYINSKYRINLKVDKFEHFFEFILQYSWGVGGINQPQTQPQYDANGQMFWSDMPQIFQICQNNLDSFVRTMIVSDIC